MIGIEVLRAADRATWEPLARAYKHFYRTQVTPAEMDAAWQRLQASDVVQGWGAWRAGRMVGIVHALHHASVWADRVCYLQDLYVDEAERGQGIAAALIEQVARHARANGAARLYWLTHADNARARALYDRVAQHQGYIRYDYPMS